MVVQRSQYLVSEAFSVPQGAFIVLTVVAAAGFFMDRVGSRRAPFLLCLVCLGGATALLAVGTNIGLWVAGRLFQGISAGMLWVVSARQLAL